MGAHKKSPVIPAIFLFKTWLVVSESIQKYQEFTKDFGKYDPKRGRR